MARERRGFIVAQVCATITYTDKDGHDQKIVKLATSGKTKEKLTDAEKQARKIKEAKRFIHDTIMDLKHTGATD